MCLAWLTTGHLAPESLLFVVSWTRLTVVVCCDLHILLDSAVHGCHYPLPSFRSQLYSSRTVRPGLQSVSVEGNLTDTTGYGSITG